MQSQPPRPSGAQTPQMELSDDLMVEYANLVRIAHSPSELIFDFAHFLPGSPSAKISSRIIMSPMGAKLFQRALTENLARYEAAFGEIILPGGSSLAENLFHGIHPDEK
jgi:hypothetical protein